MAEKNKSKEKESSVIRSYPFGVPYLTTFPYRILFPRFPFASPLYGVYGSSLFPYSPETMRKYQIHALTVQADHLENMARNMREYCAEIEKEGEGMK
jgi:hypothetical protein